MSLSRDKVTKVPVWVKVHKIPIVAYSKDGLSIIATQLGKPVMLDAFTNAMCAEPWGRLGFARALIEVTAEKDLKQEVTMAIPIVDREGHIMAKMDVEYEWKPPRYSECLVFRHANEQCPKQVTEVLKENVTAQSDGFTTVQNRKKKGKQVGNNQARPAEGFKELGSSSMNSAMCEFKDCVRSIEVMDIHSTGLHFTWNQKPRGRNGVLNKLDRIKGNLDFVDTYQGASAIFQPYRISDHSSSVLKIPSLTCTKPRPFKFFNFLAHKGRFLELLNIHWNASIVDRDPSNSDIRDEEAVYVQAFNEAKIDEERFLRQKAKIDWLEGGDSNSAYFHKSIKSRNQRSRIHSVTNAANVEVTGSGVLNVFLSHYESFIGSSLECDLLNTKGLFNKKVSDGSNMQMIRPITNAKIKTAMFDIGDDKALGPDGYTSMFFKKGWDVVGADVCKAIHDFFSNGKLLKEINHTFMALIPNIATPQKVNDYRPISCCNVIYKCISKILTNRIIEEIKEVLMHNYHLKRGSPRCAFKVDIQKAYDTVDWRFLGFILKCFDFHSTMIKWIMGIVRRFIRNLHQLESSGYLGKRGFTLRRPSIALALYSKLFIFAHGDVDSTGVIMASLDEFRKVSGRSCIPSMALMRRKLKTQDKFKAMGMFSNNNITKGCWDIGCGATVLDNTLRVSNSMEIR
ncbi:protein LAZ1 [Tanacetum coccineum]